MMRWRVCSDAFFFFQAEDGIRDLVRSRGLGDVYKRQDVPHMRARWQEYGLQVGRHLGVHADHLHFEIVVGLSLIHI